MENFLKPILKLLPKELNAKLNNGERIHYGDFTLFWGFGKGQFFGVDWIIREQIKNNIYSEDRFESNIYQLKTFFPSGEPPNSLEGIRVNGQFLLDTLHNMGLNPTRLTSPASIYEECVLSQMNLYRMADMPDKTLEFAEWAANYTIEWRSVYKIGTWGNGKVWDYDLSAAYSSVLALIPDFHHARYLKTDGRIPQGAFWGLLQGELDITSEISPIISDDGKSYKGKRPDLISTTDWACIKRCNIGTFKPTSGWSGIFDKLDHISAQPMSHLYSLRGSGNELQERIAKNLGASTWGKFSQRIGEKFGEYYFPLIPSMVTSKVRCKDCDFIYSNSLTSDLISVTVDGLLASKKLYNIPSDKKFGEWRINPESPALVLSSSMQWCGDKRPRNVNVNQMIEAIKSHPQSKAWNGIALRFLEHDRQFDSIPKNGTDLLNRVYESKAYEHPKESLNG